MTRVAERFGYGIALRVSIGLEGGDFTSQVLKAKAANVDAILFLGNVPEAVTLVRHRR
jgi:ABC-type branched-subunit amino acid transport system substrate-binding protein